MMDFNDINVPFKYERLNCLFTNTGFAFCAAAPLRRLLRHVMAKVGGAGRELTFYYTSTSERYWTYHS